MIPMAMCGEWPYWGDTWDGFDMVRRPPARALHLAAAPVPLTILRPRRLATPRRDDPAPLAPMLAPPAHYTNRARFRFRQPSVDTETTAVDPPPPPPPPLRTPRRRNANTRAARATARRSCRPAATRPAARRRSASRRRAQASGSYSERLSLHPLLTRHAAAAQVGELKAAGVWQLTEFREYGKRGSDKIPFGTNREINCCDGRSGNRCNGACAVGRSVGRTDARARGVRRRKRRTSSPRAGAAGFTQIENWSGRSWPVPPPA